jgi:hypothetical protein
VELRWAAQWVSNQTVMRLVEVAGYMNLPLKDRKTTSLNDLLSHIALENRMLSHLREATIPMSIASADYAVEKYEHFIGASHLREIISNGEKDLEAINSFLQRDEDQRNQDRSDRVNRLFTIGGVVLAMIAILVTLPSLWIDLEDSWFGQWLFKIFRIGPVMICLTAVILLSLVGLVAWTSSQLKKQTSRK